MNTNSPNSLGMYSVISVEHAGRYLLLRRASSKRLHPNRWTGIGGRVEEGELSDLRASALRELHEETGLNPVDVQGFALRRALLMPASTGDGLTVLLYFTGQLSTEAVPACTEGTLHWLTPEEFTGLDIIDSSRDALRLLTDDMQRDPQGKHEVRLGLFSGEKTLWVGTESAC